MTTLRALVAPSRVAIVGLDARNAPAGRALAARLVADGFAGALDLVDPAGGDGPGDTPVARRADELPSAPDLAILCVDPRDVRWQLEAVLARGAGAVAILTDDRAAGASPGREDDDDGAPAELADLAAAAGAVMLGPASAGVANPGLGLVAIPDAPALMGGAVAIIARRGPALLPLLAAVARHEVGVAWALDLGAAPGGRRGRRARGRPRGRRRPRRDPRRPGPRRARPALVALAALAADKPVVVLDPEAALFAELGAAPATTADDAARLAALLATDGAAPAGGQRVAVVTDDAALGALAAASLGATGLTLAAPGAETARRIAGEVHPRRGSAASSTCSAARRHATSRSPRRRWSTTPASTASSSPSRAPWARRSTPPATRPAPPGSPSWRGRPRGRRGRSRRSRRGAARPPSRSHNSTTRALHGPKPSSPALF
ncbi:MAG: CoA-binding protein [Deltaproteobacteria bacterium]|nr:CoA-binding protein [Deltaproteobacteria bacterium]